MNSSFWNSQQGQTLLEQVSALAAENNFDPGVTALRGAKVFKHVEAGILRRAVEIIFSRRDACKLGEWSTSGLFTRALLEQASRQEIAQHHALRFQGCRHVLEIGCGAGSDTIALSQHAANVTAVEIDSETADMARHNAHAAGATNVQIVHAAAEEFLKHADLSGYDGLWADPARRRSDGTRLSSPQDWSPPLDFLTALPFTGRVGIKVSPGLDFEQPADTWKREWIGFADECLEQILWRDTRVLEGTLFLADVGYEWTPPMSRLSAPIVAPESLAGGWIVEPHAALIRSGRLEDFFAQSGFGLLDAHIAYGASNAQPALHPLYQRFRVLEVLPYRVAHLNSRLRERNWNSRTEIKKRGLAESADEIRKKLELPKAKGSQGSFGVVILTRIGNEHYAILAERT